MTVRLGILYAVGLLALAGCGTGGDAAVGASTAPTAPSTTMGSTTTTTTTTATTTPPSRPLPEDNCDVLSAEEVRSTLQVRGSVSNFPMSGYCLTTIVRSSDLGDWNMVGVGLLSGFPYEVSATSREGIYYREGSFGYQVHDGHMFVIPLGELVILISNENPAHLSETRTLAEAVLDKYRGN